MFNNLFTGFKTLYNNIKNLFSKSDNNLKFSETSSIISDISNLTVSHINDEEFDEFVQEEIQDSFINISSSDEAFAELNKITGLEIIDQEQITVDMGNLLNDSNIQNTIANDTPILTIFETIIEDDEQNDEAEQFVQENVQNSFINISSSDEAFVELNQIIGLGVIDQEQIIADMRCLLSDSSMLQSVNIDTSSLLSTEEIIEDDFIKILFLEESFTEESYIHEFVSLPDKNQSLIQIVTIDSLKTIGDIIAEFEFVVAQAA